MTRLGPLSLISIIVAMCSFAARPANAYVVGRYESVTLAEPTGKARSIVVFFSGRSGLSPDDQAAAQVLANAGILVVEVDSRHYLHALDKIKEKCHSLAYDAEILSRQLEREHHFPNYVTPIVAGIGEGGTLAELTLDEAAPGTLTGAISVDPAQFVASRRPICSNLPTTSHRRGFEYGAPIKLPGFWIVALRHGVHKSDREYIMALRKRGAPIDVREINPNANLGDTLYSLIEPHLARSQPETPTPKIQISHDLSNLPIVELPTQTKSNVMAIVLSGDGGWRDIDKTIAEDLQRKGVPVVGLDTLRYFWSKKTPDQITKVVETLIATFTDKWHANKVALIGYSFGADVLPFAYNRLPQSMRDQVALVVLLGVSKSADFEISVGDWLGEPPGPDALPVIPEATRIPPQLVQCFYGEEETNTACPTLQTHGAEVFKRTGGHHFNGNYGGVADIIMAGLKKRTEASTAALRNAASSSAN